VIIHDLYIYLTSETADLLNVPIGVDTTKKLGLQVHVVEVIDDLFPVGLRYKCYVSYTRISEVNRVQKVKRNSVLCYGTLYFDFPYEIKYKKVPRSRCP